MIKQIIKNNLFIINILTFNTAISDELNPPTNVFYSVREQGMGGAIVSVSDDANAVFTNPAGIGQQDNKKVLIKSALFPNFILGGNKNTYDLIKTYSQNNVDRINKTEQIILNAKPNYTTWGRLGFFPNVTIKYISLGFIQDNWMHGYLTPSINNTSLSNNKENYDINIYGKSTTGLVLGGSFPYKETGLSFGLSARYLYKTTNANLYSISNNEITKTSEKIWSNLNHTKGFAYDLGILFISKLTFLPNLALTLKDIGNSYFEATNKESQAQIEKANLSIGMSYILGNYNDFCFILSIEEERLNDTRLSNKEKFKAGSELRLGRYNSTSPIAIRIGYNDENISYGTTFDILFIKLELASFYERIYGDKNKIYDHRYLLGISADIRP